MDISDSVINYDSSIVHYITFLCPEKSGSYFSNTGCYMPTDFRLYMIKVKFANTELLKAGSASLLPMHQKRADISFTPYLFATELGGLHDLTYYVQSFLRSKI